MKAVALPVADRRASGVDGAAGSRQQPTAHDFGLAAILAVSSHADTDADLPEFFARLSATVAELCDARRAAFWRLGPGGTLSIERAPFGFDETSHIHKARLLLGGRDEGAAELAVFGDQLGTVQGTPVELEGVWRAAGLIEVENSLAAPWRAGERRLGMVAVYDSNRGFSSQDFAVLRLAGCACGLLSLYRESEYELARTAARLDEAAAARRHLLNNIAAGGDEARRRFASALHDDALQLLTAAELLVERLRTDAKGSRNAVNLDRLRGTLRNVEDSLRRLLVNVSPEPLQMPVDLNDAISERLESLRIGAGIEVQINSHIPPQIPPAVQMIVLKNVAEALTNVQKHARATRVSVAAEGFDDGVRIEVRDNGKGFVVADSVRLSGHIGLVALRERAQLAGGWCQIESEPGAGTRVGFWVPLSQ